MDAVAAGAVTAEASGALPDGSKRLYFGTSSLNRPITVTPPPCGTTRVRAGPGDRGIAWVCFQVWKIINV